MAGGRGPGRRRRGVVSFSISTNQAFFFFLCSLHTLASDLHTLASVAASRRRSATRSLLAVAPAAYFRYCTHLLLYDTLGCYYRRCHTVTLAFHVVAVWQQARPADAQLNQAHSTATGPPDPGCQSVSSTSACLPSLSHVHHHTGQPIARRHRRLRVVALTVAPRRFCAQLPAALTLQTAAPS